MDLNFQYVVVCAAFVVYANAALLPLAARTETLIAGPHPDELRRTPAQYEFRYSVHDVHTGDIKDQHEIREGDQVRGRYSLIEPDGNRRVVEYSSDPLLGFNAQVRHELPYVQQLTPALTITRHPAPLAFASLEGAPVDQLAAPIRQH